MNTDIPRNIVSVDVRDEHLPLVCALRLFLKGKVTFQLAET